MIAPQLLARSAVVPRFGVRFVSTTIASTTPGAAAPAAKAATKATLTTTATASASSLLTPAAAAQGTHIVGADGRLKSSHRHFHANSSESTSGGLNDFASNAEQRQRARLLRMHEAKELAGLN